MLEFDETYNPDREIAEALLDILSIIHSI